MTPSKIRVVPEPSAEPEKQHAPALVASIACIAASLISFVGLPNAFWKSNPSQPVPSSPAHATTFPSTYRRRGHRQRARRSPNPSSARGRRRPSPAPSCRPGSKASPLVETVEHDLHVGAATSTARTCGARGSTGTCVRSSHSWGGSCRSGVRDDKRMRRRDAPAGIEWSPARSRRKRVDLVLAGHEPEHGSGPRERRVREGHPARPWYSLRDRDITVCNVEHGVTGNERGGVSVRAEAEVDEVERVRAALCVLRGGCFEIVRQTGIGRTSAAPPGGSARWSWVRLRSGSPSGRRARPPGRWSPSPRAASLRGRRTSSTASGRRRRRSERAMVGDRDPARSATICGAAPGDRVGVGEDLDLERHQALFSSCPPNCLRIADRRRSAKSSMLRDAKRE